MGKYKSKVLNYMGKKIAKKLVIECEKCGTKRLNSSIDYYLGERKKMCFKCTLTAKLSRLFIRHIFSNLKIEDSTAEKLLKDPLLSRTLSNLIEGIAKFGIRKPQITSVPVVIVWNFTNKCNLRCLHCHQDSKKVVERELSTEEAFRVVDNIADAGTSVITFSGGEPLVRKDIFKVARYASDKGIFCTIASNGTLINSKIAEKLWNSGIRRVEIGLDGASPEPHEFIRNSKGSFDKTLKGIKSCVDLGKFQEIAVTTTMYKNNVSEIPKIIDLAEELGATRFYLNRIISAGRGKEFTNFDIPRKEKIEILNYLYDRFRDSVVKGKGILCYARGMTYYSRIGYTKSDGKMFHVSEAVSGYDRIWEEKFGQEISKIVRKYASGFGGCSAGTTYAGLSPQGDLQPCVVAPIPLGNLLEEDLREIWMKNELDYMRKRNELKGRCGKCSYNEICGGCRYTAFIETGDWLEEDPSCPFN